MDFGQGTSDITGFNQDNREFAAVGLIGQDAAVFVDITDPQNPYEVGRISADNPNDSGNGWKDVKYINDKGERVDLDKLRSIDDYTKNRAETDSEALKLRYSNRKIGVG